MKNLYILLVLVLAGYSMQAQTTYLPFTESFENGIQKWTDGTTGGTSEVTTAQAVVGFQSYHLTGTATSSKLTNTFSNSIAASSIMFYVQASGSNGGNTEIGNGTNYLFYGGINGGNYVVSDINGSYAVCPVTAGEWVKVEVKKINYTTHTYDLWINDSLRKSGLEFDAGISSVNQIDLFNTSTGDEAWWDAIYVGTVEYSYPAATGNIVCLNDMANLTFSDPVVFGDTAATVFNIGPITADTSITYMHPYTQSEIVSDNGVSSAWGGNMFDIVPKKDLSVYAVQINTNGTTGTGDMKLYYREGTYVGNNTSNAGWLLHDSVTFNKNPTDGLCDVTLNKPLTLNKGVSYGIYFCYDAGVDYTDGTGTNQTVDDEYMTCTFGVGGSYFNLTNNPRVWNGRLIYEVAEEQVDTSMITTMFASNNEYAGNMMDITAKNDIIIDSLDINMIGNGWVQVYYRNGTCVGNNTSSTGWTLLDNVTVVAAGQDNPTRVALNNRLLIPAGETYGFYVAVETALRYTNDNGSNDTYTDDNLTIVGEYGGTNAFSCTSDRVWNGNIYYTVRNNEEATFGPQTSLYSGDIRGYCFVAPKDFIIKGVMIPSDVTGDQYIEILRFNDTLPPVYSEVTNSFTSLGYWTGIPQGCVVPTDIYVAKGDFIGVYGKVTGGTSYCNTLATMDLLGETVDIWRSGMQFDLITEQMHDVWRQDSPSDSKGRVNLYVEDVIMSGGPDSVLIEVMEPVVNLGTDTTICADETITLDAGSFTTFDWSTGGTSQTEMVDSTGTGIGSTNVWVVVTDAYGCEASDTITITFEDCTGIEENDMLLSVYPNPSNGVFTIATEGMNAEMFIEVISPEGRIVRQITSSESTTTLDLTGEDAGVYYVRIQIEDEVKVINLIIQ
ncbi:MAG: hypothetical protein C0592_00725 [Marinilabiliales bacterium]|nr:MAG: hypothetical protein C0592_00725 [Marinilabiliales bacterium]